MLAAVLNSPTNLDPASGSAAKQRLLGRYQYVLSGMATTGDITAAQADRFKQRLPPLPKIKNQDQYGGQKGHILSMVRKDLLAQGFSDQEISGGGLKVTTTFTKNAMHAAAQAVQDQKPKGLKQPARRGGLRRPRHRRAAGHVRRPGLPQEPAQLGRRRRLPGVGVQALRARGRHRRRLLAEEHLRRQLALRVPQRDRGGTTRDPATGNDYGSAVSLLTAHRAVDQHRLHRHDPVAWATARRRS